MADPSTFPILVTVLTTDVLPYSRRTVEFYDTRVGSPLFSLSPLFANTLIVL